MEPWIQPTTAPRQPDASEDDQNLEEGQPRVERGWMQHPTPTAELWILRRRGSIATTAFTVAVVFAFLLLMLGVFPLILLYSNNT